MTHRVLFLPRAVMPRDPETVEFKLHLAEDTFYETVLTPDEARKFALDLMIEAERALGCIAAAQRRKLGNADHR